MADGQRDGQTEVKRWEHKKVTLFANKKFHVNKILKTYIYLYS
jgi:hypothetical protein